MDKDITPSWIELFKTPLFFGPFLLFIVMWFSASLIAESKLNEWMLKHAEEELEWQAYSSIETFHALGENNFTVKAVNEIIQELSKHTETRFTIMKEDGTVIGKTGMNHAGVLVMENHAARPEVVAALKNGSGSTIRHSFTTGEETLYVTTLHQHDNRNIILRASIPTEHIFNNTLELRNILITTGIATLIILSVFIVLAVKKNNKRIINIYDKIDDHVNERVYEYEALQELGNMLATAHNVEESAALVSGVVKRLFLYDSGAITLINPSRDLSKSIYTWGVTWPGETHFKTTDCWGLRKGDAHVVHNNETGFKCAHFQSQVKPVSSLCIPMIAHGETIGVFHLASHIPEIFTDKQVKLATLISRQISLTIANLHMRDTLKLQVSRDPLTMLYNRRYMEEAFDRELQRATRHKSTFCILMIDVDHFKDFNDTFGHSAGDHVLKELALLFKSFIREEDIACRFGGEEFVIIMPEANIEGVRDRANELCKLVRNMHLVYNDRSLSKVTLSIGVSNFPEHGNNIETLIATADSCLYLAKEKGRDCVVINEAVTPVNITSPKLVR